MQFDAHGLEVVEVPVLLRPIPFPRWLSKERRRTFPNVLSLASQPRPIHRARITDRRAVCENTVCLIHKSLPPKSIGATIE